ncbi:type II toxin-antitoxin system HicB family antitoxin [Robiginitomaculum antarcticum]|uniref:type II toxin-antitoxin system HicB family antitoxin n=1 Tax=Robiginitomaculum antarcticum TaxID=437507 RepID=UPI00038085EB|nr:type II toxin-antitoxin system HicB family antitoxin [Robiginitomaculum antarcticum]
MKYFVGIVHKDEDSVFGIAFPDATGCFSSGETMDDLLTHAQEALSLYFEEEDIVQPRTLDAIQNDNLAKDMLGSDGTFLLVPLVSYEGRTVRANITIDAGLLNAIDDTAQKRGLSRSAFLADAARRELS